MAGMENIEAEEVASPAGPLPDDGGQEPTPAPVSLEQPNRMLPEQYGLPSNAYYVNGSWHIWDENRLSWHNIGPMAPLGPRDAAPSWGLPMPPVDLSNKSLMKPNTAAYSQIKAFGGIFSTNFHRYRLDGSVLPVQVHLSGTMPSQSVGYFRPNSLSIMVPGTYFVTRNIICSNAANQAVFVMLCRNGVEFPESRHSTANGDENLSLSFIAILERDDIINMAIRSEAGTLSLGVLSASVAVIKIG